MIRKRWWKVLTVFLLFYALIGGMLFDVPRLDILNETIRNLYFHVSLWFAMLLLLMGSLYYSVKYLRHMRPTDDIVAANLARVAVFLGVLGFATGALWGNYVWGSLSSFLLSDAKILGSIIALLIYFAYFVLRASIDDEERAARLAAVYSIFAYVLLIFFIFVMPRMFADTVHPGNGGNPGFATYDLDSRMRMVFYPAVIAYTLLGVWVASLMIRMDVLKRKIYNLDN